MSNSIASIVIYIVAAVASIYLGMTLRKWRDRSTKEKLIREIEALLNEPLPKYKKGQHSQQINWDRVYNNLKKQPQTETVTKLMKRVDQQVNLYYKNKAKK